MSTVFTGLIDGERWLVLSGDHYAISDHGRMMRASSRCGVLGGTILSPGLSRGYRYCCIRRDGKQAMIAIHVAVAAAFLGPRPAGQIINHKDGNKLNNHISNLEYVTQRENIHHSRRMGLQKYKLTDADVMAIHKLLASGVRRKDIAGRFKCSQRHIGDIANGKRRGVIWVP